MSLTLINKNTGEVLGSTSAKVSAAMKPKDDTVSEKMSLGERMAKLFTGSAKQYAGNIVEAPAMAVESMGGTAVKSVYEDQLNEVEKRRNILASQMAADKNYAADPEAKWQLEQYDKEISTLRQSINANEQTGSAARNATASLAKSGAADIAKAKEGLGKLGSFIADAAVAATQLAGDAAIGAAAPGASLPAMGLRSFGGAAQEAREAGASLGQQTAYGAAVGGVEMLTEKMFDGLAGIYGKGKADDVVEKVISKLAKSDGGQRVLRILSGAGGEALEEAVAGAVDPALRSIYDGEKIGKHYSAETVSDILHDMAIGAVLGGGLTAIGNTARQNSAQPTPIAADSRRAPSEGTITPTQPNAAQGNSEAQTAPQRDALMTAILGGNSTQQGVENSNSVDGMQNRPYTENNGGVINGENRTGMPEYPASGEGERSEILAGDRAASQGRTLGEGDTRNSGELVKTDLPDTPESDAAYSSALAEARADDSRNGWAVTQKSPEELAGDTKRLINDGGAGYAVTPDGDLVAVFKNSKKLPGRNRMREIIPMAIADGAQKGDCYGEVLLSIYEYSGAIPVARVEFAPEYANDGWTPDKGTPYTYVFMFSGDDADTVRAKQGSYPILTQAELDALPTYGKDGYDDALAYRDKLLAERGKNALPPSVGAADAGFSPLSHAELVYGTQDGGENAVRPDDMPVSTNGTDRVSRSTVTVKGAAVTPDDFVPLMENETMKGRFSFIPITNSETVTAAQDGIIRLGWDDALTQWRADVAAGRASAEITATGALLYNNAVNAGDTRLALDILTDYMKNIRSGGAQALQAARILKTLAPSDRLYMIRKSVEQFARDVKIPDGIQISDEAQQRYLDAKTEAEADAAIDAMIDEVAAQIPSTILDKITGIRYLNMLGNFKTQVRNVTGNVGMQGISRMRYNIAAALENIVNTVSGGRLEKTKAFLPGRDRIRAARADFAEVESAALGESKYNERGAIPSTDFMREAVDRRTVFKFGDNRLTNALGIAGKQGVGLKALEAYRKATNWAMEKGDVIFSRASYAHALAGWMKAKGITAAQWNDAQWRSANSAKVDEGRAYAISEAQQDTFRDNNAFSSWISKVGRRSDTPRAARIAAEGLLPFRKTPANILVRAEEYSPLGLINTAVTAAKAARGTATGADIINQLSKTLTGSGIMALGYMLAKNGLLRGGGDDDEKQQQFDEMTGHQDYSLELPDGTSYTLDWLTPASLHLFQGAGLAEAFEDGDLSWSDLEKVFTSLSDPMLEMSMLQGLNDLLDSLKYSKDNLGQLTGTLVAHYLTQLLTNTLAGQIERSGEDVRMSTYVDNQNPIIPAWLQREIGKASAKTPGYDFQQYPYIDQWGRTEENGDMLSRILQNTLSPGYVSNVSMSSLEKELQRLAEKTGDTAVYPQYADKSFDVDGETKYLDKDQYVRYATRKGQRSEEIASAITQSSAYRKMDDEQKAKAIKYAYEYANAEAKKSVSAYKPGDTSWLNKAFESKSKPQDYIINRVLYGSTYAALDTKALDKYDVGIEELFKADANGGGLNQAEMAAYLGSRTDLDAAAKQIIWDSVGGWKTSYADYAKKQK